MESGRLNNLIFNIIPLVFSIGAVLIGSLLFIVRPDSQMQQDIALIKQDVIAIKTNHLVHIEQAIGDNKVRSEYNAKEIQDIQIKLDRVLYLLEFLLEE